MIDIHKSDDKDVLHNPNQMSVMENNPAYFSKELANSVEQIIIKYMSTLKPTEISTLQSLVVYINFMGNNIIPKLLEKDTSLRNITRLMAILYKSNENLALAIENFNK